MRGMPWGDNLTFIIFYDIIILKGGTIMFKIIVNNTFECECSAFQERYNNIEKSQYLSVEKHGVDENFLADWRAFSDANPVITSIEFQYDGTSMIEYSHYNVLQEVNISSLPDEVTLGGTITFVQK
jgi:hypothetical protein